MLHLFSNFKIRTKLIILFIIIKVIPIILLAVITLIGINSLYEFFTDNTVQLKQTTKKVVLSTANIAVTDSILALDRKSQESFEKLSGQIAQSVADFLYERDADLLLLTTLPHELQTYQDFMASKTRKIIKDKSDDYNYDNDASVWVREAKSEIENHLKESELKDNQREFNRIDPIKYQMQSLPIYKEITFFDLQGKEQIKVSSISADKVDISIPKNTYIKAETYFEKVSALKQGQIYVSDVIGAYVPSPIIGMFTKEKAEKAGIPFTPEEYAYAGRENPMGKRFEGIIRFVTPTYQNKKKVGYVSLALDHRHIMAFTDTFDPLSYSPADASDASAGNYTFMWDYVGRSISHARDYSIAGFDPKTGQRATPWLSSDVEEAFKESNISDINEFLDGYPTFDNQSLEKKPSVSSIKKGLIGLDCRYLNFAPQCQGWMQLTENGGLGSFIIFWSNIWKLTTAATIPYYTGHYGETERGFGFVTMGANIDEFHKAAYETQNNLDIVLVEQLSNIDNVVSKTKIRTKDEINLLVNKLTITTLAMVVFMIVIAIWLSSWLRLRLQDLIVGAKQYSQKNLSYRIPVDSKDEIGMLSHSFNSMADSLQDYVQKEKDHNLFLESRIDERTQQLTVLNGKIQRELMLKEQNEKQLKIYANVFNNTTEAIIITDINGVIEHVNEAFTEMTGFQFNDVLGHDCTMLKSHKHDLLFYKNICEKLRLKEIWEGEIWACKKDGSIYPTLMIIIPILDSNGKINNFAAIHHDMSEIKKNEAILHRQAYYDPLTKLANRTLGYDRLEHAILSAKANKTKVAVIFLDLDKFKQVNDTMGHDAGDLLLCQVGNRLSKVCKVTDTISRLGGDEFLIIIEGFVLYEDVIHIVENITNSLVEPFVINDQFIHTSTSIGITFYPDDDLTVHQLLKNADIAMYRAKTKGRGMYEIFTKELSIEVQKTVQLEQALQDAVNNKEFMMHYQPITSLKDRQVVGFEALMRWQKKGEIFYPEAFIDSLEHTKLIISATEGVMADIFAFTSMVNRRYKTEMFVSINISAVHFELDDFCERLMKIVNKSGLKTSLICLEVTETIFLEQVDLVVRKLTELRQFGFKIAMDDFGTGYSSLSYLKTLPLDKIKIDREFIQDLPHSPWDAAITNSVCTWCNNFDMEAIAEGVETEEQLAFLEKIGCTNIQGYLFAKPMSEPALVTYLDSHLPCQEVIINDVICY